MAHTLDRKRLKTRGFRKCRYEDKASLTITVNLGKITCAIGVTTNIPLLGKQNGCRIDTTVLDDRGDPPRAELGHAHTNMHTNQKSTPFTT